MDLECRLSVVGRNERKGRTNYFLQAQCAARVRFRLMVFFADADSTACESTTSTARCAVLPQRQLALAPTIMNVREPSRTVGSELRE